MQKNSIDIFKDNLRMMWRRELPGKNFFFSTVSMIISCFKFLNLKLLYRAQGDGVCIV